MRMNCGRHDLRSPRLIARAASLGDGRALIQGLDFSLNDRAPLPTGRQRGT